MRTGVRLTCLKNGDPLLGEVWIYNDLMGEEAISKKLEDLFFYIDKLKFSDIIDTIQINKNSNNQLYIGNSGINGDLWPFDTRIELYRVLSVKYELNMVLEIEFPTVITAQNLNSYAAYATQIIDKYSWVKYWQIMTEPESRDSAGVRKCSPLLYVKLIKYIYETIHTKYSDVKIGGPGICNAIVEYVNSEYYTSDNDLFHTGWLATATGEYYGIDPADEEIGPSGFLKYIDFFAFQGRQNYSNMNYSIYTGIIQKLRQGLITQAQRDNYNFNVEFLSTYQGHDAEIGQYNDLQLQAYRDLREFINAFKVNVIPFKTQLVDEFYDPNNTSAIKVVSGILYYFLGNEKKPAYKQYEFLLKHLEEYTQIADNTYYLNNKRPYVVKDDLHAILLMNEDKSMLGTVIFPANERNILVKNPTYTSVTLKPAINRKYYLPSGEKGNITQPLDIVFRDYDFVFVEENINLDTSVDPSVLDEAEKKIKLYSMYAKELLDLVPDDYVKDVYDGVNFPKLLHSLAVQHGDLEYDRQILEDNMYLSTAHGDAIYNNFGAMIQVPWRNDWDEEKYRTVVSALIEALLNGATKSSIQTALKKITTFDIHIYELYKDYEHFGMTKEQHFQNQYSFIIEVEKDIDSNAQTEKLYDDIRMFTDIIRPAHTIPIIVIVLVAKEDYKDWYENKYGVAWKDSDKESVNILNFEESNKYGWKSINYDANFHNNLHNLNSNHVLGPKYTLHDNHHVKSTLYEQEIYDKVSDISSNNIYGIYSDKYDKSKTFDVRDLELLVLLNENKYGMRPVTNTLITNIGTTWGANTTLKDDITIKRFKSSLKTSTLNNDFVTGFDYFLSEEEKKVSNIKLQETFKSPKENNILELQIFEQENIPTPVEKNIITSSISLEEPSYRYIWYKTLHTYVEYNKTFLNYYKTALGERLQEDVSFISQYFYQEKYKKVLDQPNITLNIDLQEQYQVNNDECDITLKTQFEEYNYNYIYDNNLKTYDVYNNTSLNLNKTSLGQKINDSCYIKIYKVEDGNEILLEEIH